MRWMKHATNASQDEKLALLVSAGGLEAYGFYWRIMEILASHIEDISDISVAFPVKTWSSLLGVSTRKFKSLLEVCSKFGVFDQYLTNISENPVIRIACSSLLCMADEYTARKASHKNRGVEMSGQSPDTLGTMSAIEKIRLEKIRLEESKSQNASIIENLFIQENSKNLSIEGTEVGTTETSLTSIEKNKALEETSYVNEKTTNDDEHCDINNPPAWPAMLDALFRQLVSAWPADRVGDVREARRTFYAVFPRGLPRDEADERLKNIEGWASVILGREPQYVPRLDRWLSGLDVSISPTEEKPKQPEWVPVEEVEVE